MLDDRETEPGSAGRPRASGVDPIEALGDSRDLIGGNPDAGVLDRQLRAVAARTPRDVDAPGRRRETDGVVDQVVENGVQLDLVAEQRAVGLEVQLEGAPLGASRELADDALEEPRDVDEFLSGARLRRLEPRELDQILEDLRHPVRLATHLLDRDRELLRQLVVLPERVEIAANHGQRRAQLVRCIRDEIAAHRLELHLPGDVAHDREPLILPVRDQRDREPRVLPHRRRDRHLLALRRREIAHEIRVTDEIVDAVADVARGIETEQPRRRRIAPEDLVIGVQDDAAAAERAAALPDRAQQAVILLLTVARLDADLVDAREQLGPEPPRLDARQALLAEKDAVEQIDLPQHVRDVERERRDEPPADGTEP